MYDGMKRRKDTRTMIMDREIRCSQNSIVCDWRYSIASDCFSVDFAIDLDCLSSFTILSDLPLFFPKYDSISKGTSCITEEARNTHRHEASTCVAPIDCMAVTPDDAHCNSEAKKAKLNAFPIRAAIANRPISFAHLSSDK